MSETEMEAGLDRETKEISDIPAALILKCLNNDNHQTSLQITGSIAPV